MYNILVTGVGAIIGYGIIKSLRKSKYKVNIIGIDIYEDAVGQHWCDHFERGILASDPSFSNFLLKIIDKYQIDLVIPGIEQDINRIVKDFEMLKNSNAKFVLNNFELLNIAEDKWTTRLKMEEHGIRTIPSYIKGKYSEIAEDLGVPMLLKPRRSYASKGITEINCEEDFNYWLNKMRDNFMVQRIIGNSSSEFTAGVFVTNQGDSQKIIMQRQLSGEGATSKAKVIINKELENEIDRLITIFKPEGPTNFQFRYEDGYYYLLEINPRISSSTSLRTSFGYNEAEMCVEYYLENRSPALRKLRMGSAVRYIEDWVDYVSDNI
ncbi:ATP-grasp domain-containing protein [Paenibacillus favisporus]|uniref:ATP-grasp domain-containing protein n=1 Tax=Paenibacillus favisporus TaxID=221028 RepID=UPI003D2E4F37